MAKANEIVGLDCDAGASLGLRLVLSSRLEEMCALRAAALEWSDPEGVHDMRVASRRLRSAIKDFSPYLRENKLRGPIDDSKQIAEALGDVRDRDVAIIELEKKASEAPADAAVGIGHLISHLRSRRTTARAKLVSTIAKRKLATFQSEFETALDNALKVSRRSKNVEGTADKSCLSFREAGRNIIKTNFQKLQDISVSLYAPFKTKRLHRMRIAAKRLRYATKLFAPCWMDGLAPFDKEIAGLQTSLGELHDCDMWIAELGERLNLARAAVAAGANALDGKTTRRVSSKARKASESAQQAESACLWLLSHFVKVRTEHYRSALTCWHEWERIGFSNRLFAVIEDKPLGVEVPSAAISPAAAVAADILANEGS